jgi:hypothetical protein
MWWKVRREGGRGKGPARARRGAAAAILRACEPPCPTAHTTPPPQTPAPQPHPHPHPQNVKMWFVMAGVVGAIIMVMVMMMCGVTLSRC